MKPIGHLLRDQNIILEGADIITQRGYTMVPNHILTSKKLSVGAKLAYATLLKYAWQNDFCFPGQERLAEDMGVSKRSVVKFIKELETAKLVEVKRRGQGRSNEYTLKLKAKIRR